MVHFYENFLAAYDPKLRKSRGVWYTPQSVVKFIVGAVDDILKNDFGIVDGLADSSIINGAGNDAVDRIGHFSPYRRQDISTLLNNRAVATICNDGLTGAAMKLGRVFINDTQYFDNVPQEAWGFYIGGYQPAQKWLKDRKGRTLNFDDVSHYRKIISILTETGELMKEIDNQ